MSESIKTIIRTVKNKNYVTLDNRPLSDDRLSWKAKGIWAYLISKPDNWTVIIEDIIKRSTDGQRAVRSGIQELQDAGYMVQAQERDEDGKILRHFWIVFEQPVDPDNPPDMGASTLTKRKSGDKPILLFSINGLSTNGLSTNGKRNTSIKELNKKELNNTDVRDDQADKHFGEAVKAFEQIGGSINSFQAQSIQAMVEDWAAYVDYLPDSHPDKKHLPEQVVALAIQEMGKHISRPNLKYLEKILHSWRESGINSRNKPSASAPDTYDQGEYAEFINS